MFAGAPKKLWFLDLTTVVAGLSILAAVLALTPLLASDLGDAMTRNTVRLALAWYAVALCLMMRLAPGDWAGATPAGRLARWCWSWAVIVFLVHLAVAFHYFHHWSHAHAFERTREVSGVGEGIYISYLFTVLWVADCAWWWIRPAAYARRAVSIDRTLHAFMLFIVFNGMVVFEAGPIRWAGLALFALLTLVWFASRGPRPALTT